MFHEVAFSLPNSYSFRPLVMFLLENDLRKPPESAEFLGFVIKRRSANFSWPAQFKGRAKLVADLICLSIMTSDCQKNTVDGDITSI